MREREQLTAWEKDYISSRLTGWKVVSFFLPGLWQMWSRRRWLFWWWICIALWLWLLGYATWDSEAMNWAGWISWLINVILTLVKFSEKAYKHDMPYFQRYLDDYAKMNGWITKRQSKEYDEDEEPKTRHNQNLYYNEPEDEKEVWKIISPVRKYDKYGFDKDGYNRQWYDAYWFDRDWFNRQWYNEEGYDKDGFDKNGYNYKWFDKDGFDKDGYNKRWFDRNGLDKDWYDEYWEKKGWEKKKPTRKTNSTVLSGKSKK